MKRYILLLFFPLSFIFIENLSHTLHKIQQFLFYGQTELIVKSILTDIKMKNTIPKKKQEIPTDQYLNRYLTLSIKPTLHSHKERTVQKKLNLDSHSTCLWAQVAKHYHKEVAMVYLFKREPGPANVVQSQESLRTFYSCYNDML